MGVVNEIIIVIEPLYVILRKVDMEKYPQMHYLRHMIELLNTFLSSGVIIQLLISLGSRFLISYQMVQGIEWYVRAYQAIHIKKSIKPIEFGILSRNKRQ